MLLYKRERAAVLGMCRLYGKSTTPHGRSGPGAGGRVSFRVAHQLKFSLVWFGFYAAARHPLHPLHRPERVGWGRSTANRTTRRRGMFGRESGRRVAAPTQFSTEEQHHPVAAVRAREIVNIL